MSQNPKVSVIIIFLNTEQFIKEAIESVLAQTYLDWELLLVDDGSSDESTETAQSYTLRYPYRVFYLNHAGHRNLGMSASRNLGIRSARGEFIAFLDADDYWLPVRLATHVKLLEECPTAGMLYGSAKYWYSWTGRPEDQKRDYAPARRIQKNTLFDPPQLLPLFLEGKVEIPSPCSILVRREAVERVGGFEDSFRGMYEDQVFYTKICLSEKVLAVGDCLSWYRQHSKSHVSVTTQADQTHSLHYLFLRWVQAYCHSKHLHDKSVLRATRRQLWLYNSSSPRFLARMVPDRSRWVKKWILRAEEFLPAGLRNRLWSVRP